MIENWLKELKSIWELQLEKLDEQTRSDHEGGWGNILDKLNDVMS